MRTKLLAAKPEPVTVTELPAAGFGLLTRAGGPLGAGEPPAEPGAALIEEETAEKMLTTPPETRPRLISEITAIRAMAIPHSESAWP
jgi:hypothetical protein